MTGIEVAADIVGVAAPVGSVLLIATVLVLPRFPRIVGYLAAQPVRSAARTFRDREEAAKAQARVLARELQGSATDPLPTTQLVWAALQAIDPLAVESEKLPYRHEAFETLYQLVRRSLDPRRRGVLIAVVAAEAWEANRTQLERADAYLSQFVNLLPTTAAELATMEEYSASRENRSVTFAEFSSCVTGATVLLDTAQIQGGCAKGVLVMHRPEWEGPWPHPSDDDGHVLQAAKGQRTPYAARHQNVRRVVMSKRLIGQYDGRVPTLASAELVERPGLGGAHIVLTTRETCYATTEPPFDGLSDVHCKGLAPLLEDPQMSRFRTRGGGLTITRAPAPADVARVVQLNVVLGLLARTTDSIQLILVRRTDKVRNAAGGLGPSSGGVIELPVNEATRDGDAFGAVDPRAGALRELEEELGISLGAGDVDPVAVYLSNVRNRPVKPGRLKTGQTVATVLFLGRYAGSEEDVKAARCLADPTEGAFETSGLLAMDLGDTPEDFARSLFRPDHGAARTEEGVFPNIYSQLEQSALLTCMYASAAVHGAGPTARAFADQLDHPWWATAWSPAEGVPVGGAQAKLCREPGDWIEQTGASDFEVALDSVWPGSGHRHMVTIRDFIRADAEHLDASSSTIR